MALNRREVLAGLGTAAAAAALRDVTVGAAPARGGAGFPRKADFAFEKGVTYLSGAFRCRSPRPTRTATR